MEGSHHPLNKTISVQRLHCTNCLILIWTLGSNQGRFDTSWCSGPVVPPLYTWAS